MVIKILASAIRLLVTFVLGIRIEVNLSNVHFETGINMAFKMKLIIYIYIYSYRHFGVQKTQEARNDSMRSVVLARRLKKQEATPRSV